MQCAVQVSLHDGDDVGIVTKIEGEGDEKIVTVDFNSEFAGQHIYFNIDLISIEESWDTRDIVPAGQLRLCFASLSLFLQCGVEDSGTQQAASVLSGPWHLAVIKIHWSVRPSEASFPREGLHNSAFCPASGLRLSGSPQLNETASLGTNQKQGRQDDQLQYCTRGIRLWNSFSDKILNTGLIE